MKKVYQRIDSPNNGDCFKCSICSLLELDYDNVPNFVEYGNEWFIKAYNFLEKLGYELYSETLWNPNIHYLENPTECCFQDNGIAKDYSLDALKPEHGINGLFLAGVYSPKYTNPNEHPIKHLHSVLCDSNFNIVFDPQKNYENIKTYPYAKLIGYNGIRTIDTIRKIV